MRSLTSKVFALVTVGGILSGAACSGTDSTSPPDSTGGVTGAGGSPSIGGTAAGASALGGALATGGANATGGATSTGGTNSVGGAATGGASATGGSNATGGSKSTGGTTNNAGTAATGGTKASGGTVATGGVTGTGGTKASGGTVATGGTKATGGSTAAGGGCVGGTNSLLNSLLPKTMYWANATTEAATWLLGGGTPATTVTRNMTAAGASKFAVFTTYYSVNVNPNATGFATWIDGIGKAIGAQSNPAVVVLEPDAYPGAGSNQAKHDMLNAAIGTLKQDAPNAAVFLDIGNSGWLSAQTIATKVKTYSNYALIDGWASNTSNFHPTPNEVTYAQQLWALTCKPTIIDTSRNGLGKMPSTIINPPASEWAVGASFAWWPDNPAVFFNYHNKPWNESD